MNQLTYPITPDGLGVDVLIHIDGDRITELLTTGQPMPVPIRCQGMIDSGTNMTSVSARVLQRLGIPILYQTTTQTITGSVAADVYNVSLSIADFRQSRPPQLVHSPWQVMEMPSPLGQFDVLVGLDVLRTCKFLLDGPGGHFTLEF